MAINQTEQFAKWISDLANGSTVSLHDSDPDLTAALTHKGVPVGAAHSEFLVSMEPAPESLLTEIPSVTQFLLTPSGGDLASLLRRAAARGFLPESNFEPPAEMADWILFRRADVPLRLKIDSLEAATADLEAERERLRELLKQTRKELRTVKNSPAWHAVLKYREWLNRRREGKWLSFRFYDNLIASVTAKVIQAGPPEVDDAKMWPIAPATRFTPTVGSGEDWRRIFRGLAAHAGLVEPTERPRISVITPLWNTKPAWLAEAAVSLFDQTSNEWEWCLVDDCSTNTAFQEVLDVICAASPRVRTVRLERNGGISKASNEGLRIATGEFACFLDHDDLLHPEAIELCLERLKDGFDAVYTDSNKANEDGACDEPFYKPDWSPEYFRSVMYVGHLLCVRRDEAVAVGGFDSRFDGVQDFEFFLRYSERHGKIHHIPKILYQWRRVEGSTATSTSAKGNITELQQRAVAGQLQRLGMNAKAVHGPRPHRVTVEPGPRKTWPRVSVIIPTKNAPEMLSKCLDSITRLSSYKNLQIICADNDTTDEKALALMKLPQVDRVACPGEFNFSRVNNDSARLADGEYLVFLNNDIEVMTSDWIEQMLYHAEQEDAGAVGALLLYPDRRVQHCGIALGFRGTADHMLRGADSTGDGYAGSLAHARESAAVTAACLMVRKSLFNEIGGFSEHYFTAYQDVDLCLRILAMGKRNIFTPRAVLLHHESYSRKSYYDMVDRNLLLDSWEELIEQGDPYYSINFDRERAHYQIADDADRGEVPKHISLWSPGKSGRANAAQALSK